MPVMSLFWLGFLLLFSWLLVLSYLVFKVRNLANHKSSNKSGLRPWSLIRFNPFPDTGGEQSFIVCLLNDDGDGLIITSLHGRGVTRFYVKKVVLGKADQELSSEEKTALNQALK